MRLIDADKLKIDIDCNIDFGGLDNRLMILGQIDNAPTIDAIPINVSVEERKGKWEETRYRSYDPQSCKTNDDGIGFRCSNCANVFKVTSLARYHYCPNCGAEMKGCEE